MAVPNKLPALPMIDLPSVKEDRDELFREATAQIQSDFPNLRLRERTGALDMGGGAAAPAVAGLPALAPMPKGIVTFGNDPVEPPPPPEEEQGILKTIATGLGETAVDIIGFVPDTANTIADILPDFYDQGLVIDRQGIRWAKGDEYRKKSYARTTSDVLDNFTLGSDKTPANVENIEKSWTEGDKWKAAGLTARMAVEQGIISLPHMIAAVANAPAYSIGLAGDYAQQRAKNDGRDKADMTDALWATATAGFVALMEKYGGDYVLGRLSKAADKSGVRRWLEGILAETLTETVQNPAEFVGQRIGTRKEGEITPRALTQQAAGGAVGGLGGGATVGGAVQVANAMTAPAPAQQTRRSTAGGGTPPPAAATGGGAPPPAAGGRPAAPAAAAVNPTPAVPPAPGTAASAAAATAPAGTAPVPLAAGDSRMFQPPGLTGGAVVQVQSVDPKTGTAIVARVDEDGEVMLDKGGQPITFVATFEDLGVKPVPAAAPATPPAATPAAGAAAAPIGTPAAAVAGAAAGATAPPAATSTEPTNDILGQLKDMRRNDTPRRGVYISPETIAKMQAEGTYNKVLKSVHPKLREENFDGQGGLLIVRSKKDLDEARAARDGGQTDMQAIVGALTGAGVAKPAGPAVVVQRTDENGAVVQQTATPPGAASRLAAAASATLPGTTTVTTPAAALADRASQVEQELLGGPPTPPAPTPTPAAPARTRPKTVLEELDTALAFAQTVANTPKGGLRSVKPDIREYAHAVGSLAQALRKGIAEAQRRGATAEEVKPAADAAKRSEGFTEKTDEDFNRSSGVSQTILNARLKELSDAVALLRQLKDRPTADKPATETKGSERRKAENAALRERVEAMTPEEREAAIMRHDLTGLPNRRAMEHTTAPAWAEVDADSLKWVNDNMGEEAGNDLLKAVGHALNAEEGVTAFHISGDEFYVAGESQAAIEAALKRVAKALKDVTISGQGHEMSPAITWGVGETRKAASAKMKSHKVAREGTGKRAKRGEAPPSAKKTTDTVAYHGTQAKDLTELQGYDIGLHVGDRATAEKVAKGGTVFSVPVKGPTLRVEEPAEGAWHNPMSVILVLRKAGIEVPQGLAVRASQWVKNSPSIQRGAEVLPEQRKLLKELTDLVRAKGYQSIVYDNKYEGGGDSYIVLNRGPVKAVGAAPETKAETKVETKPKTEVKAEPAAHDKAIAEFASRANVTEVAVRTALVEPGKRAAFISKLPSDMRSPFKALAESLKDVPKEQLAPKVAKGSKRTVVKAPKAAAVHVDTGPTATQQENAAAAAAAPAKAPDVNTHAVTPLPPAEARPEVIASELLGATPQDLVTEFQNDTTGRVRQAIAKFQQAATNPKGWVSWLASAMSNKFMTPGQRSQFVGLIRDFANASPAELEEARGALLEFMSRVDGKAMPEEVQAAAFEAAGLVHEYNASREALEEDEDYQDRQAETGTVKFNKGELKRTDAEGNVVSPNLRAREAGEVAAARGKGVGIGEVDMGSLAPDNIPPLQGAKPTRGREIVRRRLYKMIRFVGQSLIDSGAMDQVLMRSYKAQHGRGTPMSSHQLMNAMIKDTWTAMKARSKEGKDHPVDLGFMQLLTRLRDHMPDVPVEIIDEDQTPITPRGAPTTKSGGAAYIEGHIQISVPIDEKGNVHLKPHHIYVMLHEMMHTATAAELRRNPKGRLAKRFEKLRKEIVAKVERHYGKPGLIKDMQKALANGTFDERTDLHPYLQSVYGLMNIREMAAEVFSPDFIDLLDKIDQTPQKSWVKRVISKIAGAISEFTGSAKPGDRRIVNELLNLTTRTMSAQRGRVLRTMRQTARAGEIAASIDGTEARTRESMLSLGMVRGSAGNLQASYDADTYGAYTMGPRALWNRAARARMDELGTRRGSVTADILADADLAPPRLDNTRLREHDRLSRITSPGLTRSLGRMAGLMRSGHIGKLRDVFKGLQTLDFLVRRNRRWFGNEGDPNNPLTEWKNVRDTRRSFANQLMELAERTVNSKWMKLTATESQQMGEMLQFATQWQIDPTQGTSQTKHMRGVAQKTWEARVKEANQMWAELSAEQKEIYHSVQKYFKTEYARIRKASIDLAVDVSNANLSDQQRQLLYAMRNPHGVKKVIGKGLAIDLGDEDANNKFARTVADLIKVSTVRGPYFPLSRQGEYVVEAQRRGVYEQNGQPVTFDTKDEAEAAADTIRAESPKNRAKVKLDKTTGKYSVVYSAHHVSFHKTQAEAMEAQEELRQQGLQSKHGVYTRKLQSVQSMKLSGGLQDLVAKAENKIENLTKGSGKDQEQARQKALMLQQLRSAFVQILAERAASAAAQTKREGAAGFKGKEAHETFARRARASSWHYANLRTTLAQSKSLARLRKFALNPNEAPVSGVSPQNVVNQRGDVLHELVNRMQTEEGEIEATNTGLQTFLGQAGFATFLGTPSYAIVNAMQNLNVAMPFIQGKYGFRGTRALMRGMKVAGGPALLKSLRGLVSKPGGVTSYDVYQAIAEAVKQDERFARFAQGENSPLQQLVDRNVINATYVQELSSIGTGSNRAINKSLEYLRLLPQGAELMNRISTALAVLDATNGNVDAAADVVDQVHFQYSLENRPRFFRKIGGVRVPQAVTMFKMYGVAMTQLTMSLAHDAAFKAGGRAEAAKQLGGIIAMHTLFAGVTGGVMIEPVRLMMWMWNALFGDDDEFKDIDTAVANWATDVTGSELGGRVLAKGLPNLLGFDISDRIGLDRLLMYRPPEGMEEQKILQTIGGLVAGPMGSEMIRRGSNLWNKAVVQGKPGEAMKELLPVKAMSDAVKAWELLSRGVQNRSGETLAGPEKFNIADAVGRALGFRTTEEVKLSDMGTTTFKYNKWHQLRVQQLTNRFWSAYDSGDAEAISKAQAQIEAFNAKNPGAPITSKSLVQSKRGRVTSAQERLTGGRNPDLQELLAY